MALKYLENNSPETDALVQVEPHVWEHKGSLVIQALRQALAQPEQEPEWVATIGNWGKVEWKEGVFPQLGDKLYTAPPKREWVGLTGDEISECWGTGNVVTAVEAKLKEKNGG